ncbi:MAG: hypothetical protein ACKOC5_10235 [Chloroflexota bacterium]
MSLTFSRSMRSLRLDSFRAARVGLALAALNMLALLGWFFLARVTLYEVGTDLAWTQESSLVSAAFTPEALARLRHGQDATLRVNPGAGQAVLAVSTYVYRLPESGRQVLFVVNPYDLPEGLRQGKLTGQVEVAVERVTPFELVMRNSGKFLSSSPAAQDSRSGQGSP